MSWKIYFIFAVVFAADDYTRVTTRKNEASEGLDQLGWHFVRSAPANENMVCSPFSVAGVLHMLAAGSQGRVRQSRLGNFILSKIGSSSTLRNLVPGRNANTNTQIWTWVRVRKVRVKKRRI